MATTYEYNSFNQVKKQFSPDGGTSEFWYDRLGRLVASQNEEQRLGADTYGLGTNRFSYTKYDALGRITEVGEKTNASANPRTSNFLDIAQVNAFLNTGSSAQITKTIYDQSLFPYQNPSTSRKRVSATTYQDTEAETDPDASYYSYDIMGNVKTLIQRSKMLVAADNSNGEKRIDYQYDLISGKVNKVIYQPGKGDQFIHRYDYDADNRIISVNTSRDGLVWQNDAKYVYHLHGPLARTELGDQKVQGLDYAYTLQGWLKGVNSTSFGDAQFDIGQDGKTGGAMPIVARDAFGFSLDFYVGDYKPIGQQAFNLNHFSSPANVASTQFRNLYNGNIGGMVTNIGQLNEPQYTRYWYDQLNRIKAMDVFRGLNVAFNTWTVPTSTTDYQERVTYDPNGNIITYQRNGRGTNNAMDNLTYYYASGNNKLRRVTDAVTTDPFTEDISTQTNPDNYTYDRIGNLTADASEGISSISWTVYGKIKSITKSNGTIDYRYDASGSRIYKKTFISGVTTETYYARDAQGNVMAVYEKQPTTPLKWMEQHLYGSIRLGMWNLADVVPGTTIPASGGTVEDDYLYGSKFFELSNHLDNVLVTLSDKKIGIDDGGNGTTDYFQPDVLAAQDYYSFGMAMPGREFGSLGRYGFNGKEQDKEVKGSGAQYDYGFRIYDPKLGKFLSVDPLTKAYPELTPYQFASNRPIEAIGLDGLESKDLYMELEPVRQQRRMEQAFGIRHDETPAAKAVGIFVQVSLGSVVLAPVLAEAPLLVASSASRLFWWAAANPETAAGVAYTIIVAASGYEGPDIPGPGDDFGRMGRKVYNKLTEAGINSKESLSQAARNSYNAIINTIDNEIKSISTLEQKAKKAFDIRNKAKDFAREMSGPELKKAAEEQSLNKHGNINGPSFDDLFKKNYDAAIKSGLKEEDARNKAYQGIIDASKRPDQATNKKYGAN